MKLNQHLGIDLTSRKMWYESWPVDKSGKYRDPLDNEKEEIFCKAGEAVRETLIYFEECGGNTDKLIKLLNEHVLDKRFIINRETLLDKRRWYNNEYYFYFIMFTKKVIGRFDFHYGEDSDKRLSIYHSIYEKGFIEKIPWGIDENRNFIRDHSTENICNTYSYVIANYKNGKKIFNEINIFLNLFLSKHKNKHFDLSFFLDQNYWFTSEIMCYFYSFVQVFTNDNKILYKTNLVILSPLLKAMAQVLGSIRNIYKNIPNLSKKYNNVVNYEIVKLTNSYCIIRYYYQKEKLIDKYSLNVHEAREMIHNAICMTIPNIYNGSMYAKCEIRKSYVNGDDCFEGKFLWKNKADCTKIIQVIINILIIIGIIVLNIYSYKFEYIYLVVILILINLLYFSIKKNFDFINFFKIFRKNFDEINKSKDDLTAKLQDEKDLLEIKVDERTTELTGANEKLKVLDKMKTNFFANISHEFRTPLTLILAPLKSLMDGFYGKKIDYNNNIFMTILNNCLRLLKLINNLLDFSKIEAGKMEIKREKVDIVKLVRLFVSNIESACKSKNIKLIFESDIDKIISYLDKEHFESIFFNIFGNAYKFTPEGGRITIELKKDKNHFILSISDTGIGIPIEKQKMIFERFSQVNNSSTRKHEGAGIGLSLIKELVELHDGEISVKSAVNKGATFIVRIPIIIEVKDEVKGEGREYIIKEELLEEFSNGSKIKINLEHDKNKKNIMVIEDNNELLSYLIDSMKNKYNVYYAVNGKDALKKLEKMPKPVLIISDIMMAEMGGYQFYEKLIMKEKYLDIPFIFLSAKSSIDDRIKGLSKGAIDFISKPFDIKELLLKIDSIIKQRQSIKKATIKKTRKKLLEVMNNKINENIMINFEKNCRKYNISKREKEIIKFLLEGKLNKEISWELKISNNTIRNHINNIYQKCNVQTRVELINSLKQ